MSYLGINAGVCITEQTIMETRVGLIGAYVDGLTALASLLGSLSIVSSGFGVPSMEVFKAFSIYTGVLFNLGTFSKTSK